MNVERAVIPAAGVGTRFGSGKETPPLEMMPALDSSTAEYAVEKAVTSGVDDGLVITGHRNRAVKRHFDSSDTAEQGREEDDFVQEYVQ